MEGVIIWSLQPINYLGQLFGKELQNSKSVSLVSVRELKQEEMKNLNFQSRNKEEEAENIHISFSTFYYFLFASRC